MRQDCELRERLASAVILDLDMVRAETALKRSLARIKAVRLNNTVNFMNKPPGSGNNPIITSGRFLC